MTVLTPTLDKIKEVHVQCQALGEFLEWLTANYSFGTWCEDDHSLANSPVQHFIPISISIEKILYHYFDIDPIAAEQERRAILEEFRNHDKTSSN